MVDVFTPPEWRAHVDMELVRYLSLPNTSKKAPAAAADALEAAAEAAWAVEAVD